MRIGAPIVLGVNVRMKGLKGGRISLRPVLKQALFDTAWMWHKRVFPGHFTSGARSEYGDGIEKRTKGYIFQRKLRKGEGLGKTVMNRFQNKSVRWMRHLVRVTGTGNKATVRMQAPAYFTHPYTGRIVLDDGRTVDISRQPDKPKEVTLVSDEDRGQLRAFYMDRVVELLNAELGKTGRSVTGWSITSSGGGGGGE